MISNTEIKLKSMILKFLSRRDFEQLLLSKDLKIGVKNIIEKPVGILLYDSIINEDLPIVEILRKINEYTYARLGELKEISVLCRKVTEQFNSLFDIVNLSVGVKTILSGGEFKLIYPAGELLGEKLEGIREIDLLKEKLPKRLRWILDYASQGKIDDPRIIADIIGHVRAPKYFMSKTKIAYSYFRDSFILRLCIIDRKSPGTFTELGIFTRDEFELACTSKNLRELSDNLLSMNVLASRLGEALKDAIRLSEMPEALDLATVLTVINYSLALTSNVIEYAVRNYVLILGEAYLLRLVITFIHSKHKINELGEIINRWWPL